VQKIFFVCKKLYCVQKGTMCAKIYIVYKNCGKRYMVCKNIYCVQKEGVGLGKVGKFGMDHHHNNHANFTAFPSQLFPAIWLFL
jgi:hypothetical protein